jgi:hypothetical protein
MSSEKPIPPNIQQLFDEALPADGGEQTLALGEFHGHNAHIQMLTSQMDALRTDHNVGTFGIEHYALSNLFIWAYADGTLENALGSKVAAANYLKVAYLLLLRPVIRASELATADLVVAALDHGEHAVFFDARRKIPDLSDLVADKQNNLSYSPIVKMLSNPDTAQANLIHLLKQESGALYDAYEKEVGWLLCKNPAYAERLDALRQLIDQGHAEINADKLGSDALSALVFKTLSVPDKNRITISGLAHIDGAGALYEPSLERIDGSFAHHLFSKGTTPRPHKVTRAAIGSIAMLDAIDIAHEKSRIELAAAPHKFPRHRIGEPAIPMFDIETGEYRDFSAFPDLPATSLRDKLAATQSKQLGFLPRRNNAITLDRWEDPTLHPELSALAEKLRVLVNTPATNVTGERALASRLGTKADHDLDL